MSENDFAKLQRCQKMKPEKSVNLRNLKLLLNPRKGIFRDSLNSKHWFRRGFQTFKIPNFSLSLWDNNSIFWHVWTQILTFLYSRNKKSRKFSDTSKRGCVFLMVIWPAFRMGQNGVNDHPYHAPQFNMTHSIWTI